jgi:hypothetical protein
MTFFALLLSIVAVASVCSALDDAKTIMTIRPWSGSCDIELYDVATGAPSDETFVGGFWPHFKCGLERVDAFKRVTATNRFLVLLLRDAVNCGAGAPPQRAPRSCVGEFAMPEFADVPAPVRVVLDVTDRRVISLDFAEGRLLLGTSDGSLLQVDNWSAPPSGSNATAAATVRQIGSWGTHSLGSLSQRGSVVITADQYASTVGRFTLVNNSVVNATEDFPYRTNPNISAPHYCKSVLITAQASFAALRDYGAIVRWTNATSPLIELIPREGPTGIDGFFPIHLEASANGTLFVLMQSKRKFIAFNSTTGAYLSEVAMESTSGETDRFVLLDDAFVLAKGRCRYCADYCGSKNATVTMCPVGVSCRGLQCAFPQSACDQDCANLCGQKMFVKTCVVGTEYPLQCSATCDLMDGGAPGPAPPGSTRVNIVIAITVVVDRELEELTSTADLEAFLWDLAVSLDFDPRLISRAVVRLNARDSTKTDVEFELSGSQLRSAFQLLTQMRNALRDREPKFVALGITEVIGPESEPLAPNTPNSATQLAITTISLATLTLLSTLI